jgi:exodeoxyribonuclease-3
MLVLSWNIRQGGGGRRDAICSAIAAHNPDVIVLSEVHSDSVVAIRQALCMQPWPYCASNATERNVNSLCILSRTPLSVRDCCPVPEENAPRWLDVEVPAYGFGLGALHIPIDLGRFEVDRRSKRRFWAAVVQAAIDRKPEPFLFVGDLNTGARGIDEPGRTFVCSKEFEQMASVGWTDAWRHFHGSAFEPTWVSNQKNEYRIDHGFVSPPLLDRLVSCDYSHREREAGVSDHSILILEIAPPTT